MDHAAAQQANEALGIVCEISNILGTGLDRETLSILIGLLGASSHADLSYHSSGITIHMQ